MPDPPSAGSLWPQSHTVALQKGFQAGVPSAHYCLSDVIEAVSNVARQRLVRRMTRQVNGTIQNPWAIFDDCVPGPSDDSPADSY